MIKLTACIFICFSIVTSSAFALDVENFEALSIKADSDSGIESRFARTALKSYFQGISDILNGALNNETGEVHYAGKRKICLPKGVFIGSETALSMTMDEVKKASASGALNADWKKANLNIFVFLALSRNYPCSIN